MDEDDDLAIDFDCSAPAEEYLQGKRSKKFHKRNDYSAFSHFLIPTLIQHKNVEDLNTETIVKYDRIPYCSSFSIPFGRPALLDEVTLRGVDPVTKLVSEKVKWETVKDNIIAASVNYNKKLAVRTNSRFTRNVYQGAITLAKHLESDPDPRFSGTYNWYYTGGCLSTIIGNNSALISISNSCPGFLTVTPLKIKENNIKPKFASSYSVQVSRNDPVLQIVASEHFLGVRLMYSGHIFKINKEDSTKLDHLHRCVEEKDPLVCISIRPNSKGDYCVLTSLNVLKIWSVKASNCKYEIELEQCKQEDRWGFVVYVSDELISTSDRYSVYLRNKKGALISSFHIKPSITKCDYITNITPSKMNSKVYVTTKHAVIELDLRLGLQRKWTHMLENPPLFGFTTILNDIEVLFIGSHSLDEVCAIETKSEMMPYLLWTPNETVNRCRVKAVCLDPEISIRFELSLIGITSISINNTLYLFRSSSIGDIFYQKFFLKVADFYETLNYDLLRNWENDCKKSFQSKPFVQLSVTGTADCRDLFEKIAQSKSEPKKKAKLKKQSRIIRKKKLNPSDPLGACLLEAWDIEEDVKPVEEEEEQRKDQLETWLDNVGRTVEKIPDQSPFFVDKSGNFNESTQEVTNAYDVKSWLGEVSTYFIDKSGDAEIYVEKKIEKAEEIEGENPDSTPTSGYFIDRTGSSVTTDREERSKVQFNQTVEIMEYEHYGVNISKPEQEIPTSKSGIQGLSISSDFHRINENHFLEFEDNAREEEEEDVIPLTTTTTDKKPLTPVKKPSKFVSGF